MKLYLFAFLSCVCVSAQAAETFKIWRGEGFQNILIFKHADQLFNEPCQQRPTECLALAAHKRAPQKNQKPRKLAGHPASDHCEAIGGKVKILEDQKRAQYNFCEFPDGSMVNSWSLYQSCRKGGKK